MSVFLISGHVINCRCRYLNRTVMYQVNN